MVAAASRVTGSCAGAPLSRRPNGRAAVSQQRTSSDWFENHRPGVGVNRRAGWPSHRYVMRPFPVSGSSRVTLEAVGSIPMVTRVVYGAARNTRPGSVTPFSRVLNYCNWFLVLCPQVSSSAALPNRRAVRLPSLRCTPVSSPPRPELAPAPPCCSCADGPGDAAVALCFQAAYGCARGRLESLVDAGGARFFPNQNVRGLRAPPALRGFLVTSRSTRCGAPAPRTRFRIANTCGLLQWHC